MRLSPPRTGVSLMEIIISLTIFVMSFIALGQLIGFGADRALEIQQRSQAAQLCQSKMAEVVVGAVPLQSQAGPFDEDPEWQWSLEAEPGSVTGVYSVQLKVFRPRPDGSEISVSMSRMVLDPSMRGSAFDQPAVIAVSSSSSTGSGTPGSNSQSGSSQSNQSGSPSAQSASPSSPSTPATTGPLPSAGARPTTPTTSPSPGRTTPAPTAPATGGGSSGGRAPAAPAGGGSGGAAAGGRGR